MKLLLTSAGIKNPSIRAALLELLGKPIEASNDPLYHLYGMRQSGLADLLPSLGAVYVGLSAGSWVMTPRIGEAFVAWKPPTDGAQTLDDEGQRDATLGMVEVVSEGRWMGFTC